MVFAFYLIFFPPFPSGIMTSRRNVVVVRKTRANDTRVSRYSRFCFLVFRIRLDVFVRFTALESIPFRAKRYSYDTIRGQ